MTNISKFLIGAAFSAIILPSSAMAAVTGTSSGTFSGLSSCNTPYNGVSGVDCALYNGNTEVDVNGNTGTKVEWGSTSSNNDLVNPSTLTADNVAIGTFSTNQTNVKIAELTWFNSATRGDQTPDNFGVNYLLTISFTAPGNSSDTQNFALNITNTVNDAGDIIGGFTAADLSALSFVLPGWTVTNFHYAIEDHSGNGTPTFGGACGTANWCNPEGNTSDLFIEADFTQVPTSVPEPMTLSLFGAGLAGAAAMRLRRRKKA